MNHQSETDFENAVRRGHEQEGVNVGRLLQIGLALAIVVVVAMVLMGWLLGALQRNERSAPTATALPPVDRSTPSPQLDPAQPQELRRLRESEEMILKRYEWIDSEKTTARIPIERAMEILVEDAELSQGRAKKDSNKDKNP